MTENEDMTPEIPESTKTTADLSLSARAVIASMGDIGYSREESIAILAIASALLNGELFMSILLENAAVVKMPVQRADPQKPSMN